MSGYVRGPQLSRNVERPPSGKSYLDCSCRLMGRKQTLSDDGFRPRRRRLASSKSGHSGGVTTCPLSALLALLH
jgi:hypothetical protein